MPEQHLEVVRKLIDHWNAGDRDTGLLEIYLDPEVRLESPVASLTGAAYEGHSGIERWMSDLDDQFSEWSIAVGEIRDAREEVIALVRINARGRRSTAPLQFPAASTFAFASDGRIARIRIHLDVREALQAVGLE